MVTQSTEDCQEALHRARALKATKIGLGLWLVSIVGVSLVAVPKGDPASAYFALAWLMLRVGGAIGCSYACSEWAKSYGRYPNGYALTGLMLPPVGLLIAWYVGPAGPGAKVPEQSPQAFTWLQGTAIILAIIGLGALGIWWGSH